MLRAALDAPDGFDRFKHRELVESVRSRHPHKVVYCEQIEESTCVTYALGLNGNSAYRAIAGNFGRRIFAGRRFIEWLVKNHLEELDRPLLGAFALYFLESVWQHVGVVTSRGRIISQWGNFPVYEHGTLELPVRYGDEVRYFKALTASEALRLFVEFAKSSGLSDAMIERVILEE